MALQSRQLYAKERRRSIAAPRLPVLWLRFLIREQLLRGLPHLFQEATMVARAIDSCLQLVTELRETFQPLLIGQSFIHRVFERHGVSESPPRIGCWEH
jgi:hypothetical protein